MLTVAGGDAHPGQWRGSQAVLQAPGRHPQQEPRGRVCRGPQRGSQACRLPGRQSASPRSSADAHGALCTVGFTTEPRGQYPSRDGLLLRSSHHVCGHRGRSYDGAGSGARASPVDTARQLVGADALHWGTSCAHRRPSGPPRRKGKVWPHQREGSGRSWAGTPGSRAEHSLCTRGSGCPAGTSLCVPGQTEARARCGATVTMGALMCPRDRTSQTELSIARSLA